MSCETSAFLFTNDTDDYFVLEKSSSFSRCWSTKKLEWKSVSTILHSNVHNDNVFFYFFFFSTEKKIARENNFHNVVHDTK